MQKYSNSVLGQNGQSLVPVVGASVTVFTYPGNVLATIYSDNGVTTTTNPVTTDNNGFFAFYAANGRYSLQISYGGVILSQSDIILEDDPSQPNVTVITGGSIDNTPIGATTPSTGAFTNLSASGTLTGFVGRLLNVRILSGSGTYTPTTGTNSYLAFVHGAGGGGGGVAATAAGQVAIGGGGASGAFGITYITNNTPVAYSVGSAGAGGVAGANNGSTGGNTTFGGVTAQGGPGGVGGTATTSTNNFLAQTTGSVPNCTGASLINATGNCASLGLNLGGTFFSGAGNPSYFGGGGRGVATSGAGNASGTQGAGGGGAGAAPSAAAAAGGSGGNGTIIIYEFS